MTDSIDPISPPQSTREPGEQDALPHGFLLQGDVIVLYEVLSQSHFGITYRGEDTHLQRPVAVKEFFPDGCTRHNGQVHPHGTLSPAAFKTARDRFLDEARVLARFRHPNIVHVYAFFEEHNTAYMVMEYIEGETLLQLVSTQGRLSTSDAVHYVTQAGEALAEVHRSQLLHCDVKPDNIILYAESSAADDTHFKKRVVLVDFGLSARLEDQGNYLTRPLSESSHFGTPGYAPLEQYTQQIEFGIYTDIYALGATLYHLLTGLTPTPSADRAYGVELVPPHQLHEDISPAVSDCVMWAMQLRAEQRPQTIAAFLQRLQTSHVPPTVIVPGTVNNIGSTPSSVQTQSTVALPTGVLPNVTDQEPEEAGCLEALFAGCLTLWAIGLVIYLIGFFIYATLIGG